MVLIGDTAVGKTSLLVRFADNKFTNEHMPTIGIDFKIKMIQTAERDPRKVKL